MRTIKTILWISRHEMTGEQLTELEQIMGGPVRLIIWRDTVHKLAALAPAMEGCDAVAAVLPPELWPGLLQLAGDIPVLRAAAERIPTGRVLILPDGRKEMEYIYICRGWEQVLRAEFTVRRLRSAPSQKIKSEKKKNNPEFHECQSDR